MPSGGNRSYSWTSGLGLVIHELGHNLGVWHAGALDCGTEILYGGCQWIGYGNLFDVMGRGWYFESNPNAAYHFNAFFKETFKWITEKDVLRITKNGTYELKPLEKSGAVIAEVKQLGYPQLAPYYLEYRVPFGYDESLNDPLSQGNLGGIFINQRYFSGGELSLGIRLLDMSPTTSGEFNEDWYQVALPPPSVYPYVAISSHKLSIDPQNVFFDEASGIRITNLGEDLSNVNDPKLIFSAEFFTPQCLRFAPKFHAYKQDGGQPGGEPPEEIDIFGMIPGDIVSLVVPVENMDTILCPNSTFIFNASVPDGWQYSFDPEQVIIPQGEESSTALEITVPQETSTGNYTGTITVTNIDSGLETIKAIIFHVVEPICGDEICNGDETEETCPEDCDGGGGGGG